MAAGASLEVDVAAAAFLVEPAEAWMVALESRERAERLVRAAEMALRHGHGQQGIALIRDLPSSASPASSASPNLCCRMKARSLWMSRGGGCRCRRA